MATKITMPRLSDTMTEGTVATWLKKVGDKVSEGDILAEIETDKATMEFESFNAGTLLFIGINEGQSAPVDSVLAIIGPAGTDITGVAENFKKGGTTTAAPAKSYSCCTFLGRRRRHRQFGQVPSADSETGGKSMFWQQKSDHCAKPGTEAEN